ncbi:MAG: thioredoxin [Lachnospiraceae bacterium]
MALLHITSENYETEVLKSDKPVLLDFWAAWCGPCQMIAPVVEQVAEELADVRVGKVNTDEQPELAGEFGIMSIPTLVLIKDGKEVKRSVGAVSKQEIIDFATK